MKKMATKKINDKVSDEEFQGNSNYSNEKGVELSIMEIMKYKKIKSVTLTYLSRVKIEKVSGLKGFLGFKKRSQEEKEVTICDNNGIFVHYTPGIEVTSIRFNDRREFEKIIDFDEDTLQKRILATISNRCKIIFNFLNLKKIDWEDKERKI